MRVNIWRSGGRISCVRGCLHLVVGAPNEREDAFSSWSVQQRIDGNDSGGNEVDGNDGGGNRVDGNDVLIYSS